MNNNKAMTLIEVVVALGIFSMIALFAVSSTTVGMKIKKMISSDGDYYHTARTILRHLDTDISLAYHSYTDTKIGEQYRAENIVANPGLVNYVPVSFFKGTKDKLSFSSSSHQRMYKDTNETDTCEISYFLETNKDDSSKSNLVKRETGFIDDNLEEGGAFYTLAEGVENLTFRYLKPKTSMLDPIWFDSWNSLQGENLNTFPIAVEVSFDLLSPDNKDKKIKFREIIKILNPNNME